MTTPDGSAYFLYHSIGMYPGKAEAMTAGLSEFAASWGAFDDGQWMRALGKRQRFIDLWSDLIGAPKGTLTSAENVTTALYSLIGALSAPHLAGRRVLVTADCFPSLHFLLAGLAPRFGFTLDTVPMRDGESWVQDDDVIASWGADVGLALLTQVTSTSSHRCDLDRLVAHGREMGSLVGVDITQGVGLIPFNVDAPAVDFTLSTSLKWLCGTPGAGIIHVAEPLLRECRPELRGWFSQDNIFSWDLDAFAYAPDARRFDHGTPSALACIGSVPALEWHAAQDKTALLAHNRKLGAAIIAKADEMGLTLASPRDETRRGGSIMLRLPEQTDTATIVNGLRENGVFTDCRGRILRLSPGTVTTEAGIARLFAGLDALL
ncbi:aminotransferase class V-fold PLP-dependent enzyme [Aminobacter sp. NyZ550]|uniref:aminotransferase class V-fold PLP-dependent enzyme n=1 Tax=Aminobacter sp. NyZ550 TaxID=2979870 RepID=UPI0021D5EADB|nr:aminotransferase class V-fold PLP-dependent enzyme [Aminobacter sp. NyZ550]WAX96065.1 aminotransferase class V-fold PLP-dependent enzyme [Aminobacter sp. NyZ550]WMC96905.1 aminotransferase class V-fold PLP-dependent enzyme [Aminobacter aminovorans]